MIIVDINVTGRCPCKLCEESECHKVRYSLYSYLKDMSFNTHSDAMWYLCLLSEYVKNSLVQRVTIDGVLRDKCIVRGSSIVGRINSYAANIVDYRNQIMHATDIRRERSCIYAVCNVLRSGNLIESELPDDLNLLFRKVSTAEFVSLLQKRINLVNDLLIGNIFEDTDTPSELVNFCRNKISNVDNSLEDIDFINEYKDEILRYRNVFEEYIHRGNSLENL